MTHLECHLNRTVWVRAAVCKYSPGDFEPPCMSRTFFLGIFITNIMPKARSMIKQQEVTIHKTAGEKC
jgi:hypothetical protein